MRLELCEDEEGKSHWSTAEVPGLRIGSVWLAELLFVRVRTAKDKAPLPWFSIAVCFDALTCIKILFQCHTLFNVYFFNVGWPRFCEASPPRFASLGQQKVSTPTQRLLYICANKGGYGSWELKQIWTCCLTWDPVPSVDSFHRQLHGFCVLQLCYLYKPHEAVQVLQPGAEKHRNSGSFDICHHLEMCLACLAV
jgi:hypothetical protein